MTELGLSEQITYSTVLIEGISNNQKSLGTGFFYNIEAKNNKNIPIVITNKHVIQNTTTTKFEICKCDDFSNPNDTEVCSITSDSNNWIMHPDSNVDLCCLPIATYINEYKNNGINLFYTTLSKELLLKNGESNIFSPMENVVMVGYPIGCCDSYNHKPIIRKGITATHIKNNYQGKKEFLVDISCWPGSSGSPIFILNEGYFYSQEIKRLCAGNQIKFIGILYKGIQYSANGILTVENIPNKLKSITNIPINLGVAIKAEEILAFEKMLIMEIENGKGY